MNPVLIGVNVTAALMGLVLTLMAMDRYERLKKQKAYVFWLWAIVAGMGLTILVAAAVGLPSKILERLKPLPVVETDEVQTPTQEPPPVAEQASDRVIYVGDLDALADAIVQRLGLDPQSKEGLLIEEDPGDGDKPERDPFARPETVPEDSTPAKPASAPAAPPRRERTLPVNVDAKGGPLCTGFTSLHGKSGGPDPEGCYAVGCAEGYALSMRWIDESWNICQNYLPRIGDCYYVVDTDGSERSMHFKNGSWRPGTCS